MKNRTRTIIAVFLITLAGIGYVFAEEYANTLAQPPDIQSGLIGTRLPDHSHIPLFRRGSGKEELHLDQWMKTIPGRFVIALLNNDFPEHFAQAKVIEKIAVDFHNHEVTFVLVYLHRKPAAYIDYLTRLPSGPCERFTTWLTSLSEWQANPVQPLLLFIDENQIIVGCENNFANYARVLGHLRTLTEKKPAHVEGERK